MTECIMYNIVLGDFHPSTICVERERFSDSLMELPSLVGDYPTEALKDYIESFARTDEILPTDKTIGFVVFNLQKKVLTVSLSVIDSEERETMKKLDESFSKLGFKFELDAPEHN